MRFLKYIVLVLILVPITLCGCKEEFSLSDHISLSRENIYTSNYKGATVTAYFERSENPLVFDGIKNQTYGFLTVKLPTKITDGRYSLVYNGQTADFTFDAVKSVLIAKLPCETAPLDEFDATVTIESERTDIKFTSTVPSDIISQNDALNAFYNCQKSYIDSLLDGENFNAEIVIKVSVFKGEPYYYIAVAEKSGGFKALLIDAYTAEVLAIRNIF